ncbi:MAG: hypothetical protein DMG96_04310 [Acidobacteria bacterium]|nr:MAG: hypothetical protein DMG96_04310 [Acidobacteriota bacterium]
MQTSGGFLDGETFHFSNNLNCFIGGRGTGKSTALQALAYSLGVRDALEEHDNCPGSVVTYCEDTNGILYRFERTRGSPPIVRAKEDQSIKDVPADAFRVEFFAQGDLAEVAKNPLKNPKLLQDFLDRHIAINDLQEQEQQLLQELTQNSAQLVFVRGAIRTGSSVHRSTIQGSVSIVQMGSVLNGQEDGSISILLRDRPHRYDRWLNSLLKNHLRVIRI